MANSQTQGLIGLAVDRMIRRSVRRNFWNVWWNPPATTSPRTIFVANHHGWYDGYLMYLAMTKLDRPTVDWIAEFDAFPLFRYVGGMPFSPTKPMVRAQTVKSTIHRMNTEGLSLLLFAEGVLHRPPSLLEFGRSLSVVVKHVEKAIIVPVGLRYEMSMHERPEAFIRFGPELPRSAPTEEVREWVARLAEPVAGTAEFHVLASGTKDVNERWDMRNAPWSKG